jgi:hypothetical protein
MVVEKTLTNTTLKKAGEADAETRARIVRDVITLAADSVRLDEKIAMDEALKM